MYSFIRIDKYINPNQVIDLFHYCANFPLIKKKMTSNFHMVKKHILNTQFLKTIGFTLSLSALHQACTDLLYCFIQGNKPITLLRVRFHSHHGCVQHSFPISSRVRSKQKYSKDSWQNARTLGIKLHAPLL